MAVNKINRNREASLECEFWSISH